MTIDTPSSWSAAERDRLAVQHVPLVAHLVRETMARVPSSADRNDLLAAGLVALLAAARDAGPAGSARFAEHASVRVRGALVDELRSVDWAVRAACPRDASAARLRLDTVLALFPDAVDLAAALGLSVGDGAAAGRHADRVVEVDRRGRHERVQCLVVAVEELPERLRHVARGYFLEQRPMAELAAEVGASEACAEQLRTEALVLLRDALATAMSAAPVGPADTGEGGDHERPHARRRTAYTRLVAQQYAARRARTAASRERLERSA
ncbi:sigma-70 family RNA polymerase sigma factor [Nocardioides sp. T2.26MG-1]|uniref:sigma-70 family RNA polymerase sigma factor n=1 Tax=Nocardioides sp. T2.26MG-1 TaxID=3041166 RepID=UPI002477BB4B|nr:sigma-70 family RNA polymerase sigma factor [Nocardioides sp. T2.26MG-1]CAI9401106.1 RNA polymerase sigma factor FliA [Nocardioides sp. T2.26MG-1]